MTKRICPNCGLPWFSASAETTWTCPNCGGLIGPEHEVKLEGGSNNAEISKIHAGKSVTHTV